MAESAVEGKPGVGATIASLLSERKAAHSAQSSTGGNTPRVNSRSAESSGAEQPASTSFVPGFVPARSEARNAVASNDANRSSTLLSLLNFNQTAQSPAPSAPKAAEGIVSPPAPLASSQPPRTQTNQTPQKTSSAGPDLLSQLLSKSAAGTPQSGVKSPPLKELENTENGIAPKPATPASNSDFLLSLLGRSNSSVSVEKAQTPQGTPTRAGPVRAESSTSAGNSVPLDNPTDIAVRKSTPVQILKKESPASSPKPLSNNAESEISQQASLLTTLLASSKRNASPSGKPEAPAKSKAATPPPAPAETKVVAPAEPLVKEAPKTTLQPIGAEIKSAGKKSPVVSSNASKKITKIDKGTPDSWDSGAFSGSDSEDEPVKVYTFPMRPWDSVKVLPTVNRNKFSIEHIMEIARLKKEFDQADRTLAVATQNIIVYALTKSGGFRVLQQIDGTDKRGYNSNKDRLFNVAVAGDPEGHDESVLGTGISGTVYWGPIPPPDEYATKDIESHGLVFPPANLPADSPSHGQIKTRVRTTSRHPNYFAIARGKSIWFINPAQASKEFLKDEASRIVDTEKLLQASPCIDTGKAVRDFTFSEDDSVVASLDKAGLLRFYDLEGLISSGADADATGSRRVNVNKPMLIFTTATTTEKFSPTSVMFIDKVRSYGKAPVAQRFLLVGSKQNHSLQLWDLALKKVVQELHLPHENDTDALCHIAYHPATGIIAIAHPTRNSIYFVHLSAPKYSLKPMTQADYLHRIAGSGNLKIQTTAIMTGIREYSFDDYGQIRSLCLLPEPSEPTPLGDEKGSDPSALFELYIMHSKGITCVTVKPQHLGWDNEMRDREPLNAIKHNIIETGSISKMPGVYEIKATTESEDDAPSLGQVKSRAIKSKSVKKDVKDVKETTKAIAAASTTSANEKVKTRLTHDETSVATVNGSPKKARELTEEEDSTATKGKDTVRSRSTALSKSANQTSLVPSPAISTISDNQLNRELKKLEKVISAEVTKSFKSELDHLFKRTEENRRVQQVAENAKLETVLRLVSSTLSENVELVLSGIVNKTFNETVIPSVKVLLSGAVTEAISESFNASPDFLKSGISEAISKTMPTLLRDLGPSVAQAVIKGLNGAGSGNLAQQLTKPVIAELGSVVQAAVEANLLKVAPALEVKLQSQLLGIDRNLQAFSGDFSRSVDAMRNLAEQHFNQTQQMRAELRESEKRVDELTNIVASMSESLATLNKHQGQLLEQIQLLSQGHRLEQPVPGSSAVRELGHQRQPSEHPAYTAPEVTQQPQSIPQPKETEGAYFRRLLNEGQHERALVEWMTSSDPQAFFEQIFVHYPPKLERTSPHALLLSIASLSSENLNTATPDRLNWLENALSSVNVQDPTSKEYLPQLLPAIIAKLQTFSRRWNGNQQNDPLFSRVIQCINLARRLNNAVQS